ncbi:hypothetical protein NQZ68_002165 [Dissostichus eleginoides]|nr:hypothetical protein NQZ68_002165 [Dissostichus eleginoides]
MSADSCSYFLSHPLGLTVNRPHCGAFVASRGKITSLWSVWLKSAQRQNNSRRGNTSFSTHVRSVSGWSSSKGWQGVDHSGGLLPVKQLHQLLSQTLSDQHPLTAPSK